MRVEINSWLAVATWEWDIEDDRCSICLNEFEMPCNKCKFGGDDCATV
jgi:anaphase-promoting complex subunit 11